MIGFHFFSDSLMPRITFSVLLPLSPDSSLKKLNFLFSCSESFLPQPQGDAPF